MNTSDVPARLTAVVGESGVITEPNEIVAYNSEPRGLYTGRARCLVKPATVVEVSKILALCNAHGVGVVPQGGNTGLVGGQTPDASGDQIILSLQKLDRIRDIDPQSDAMTVEAGVTLLRAQEIAESVDRYFPLSLASEGSCTIGGNLATNAGGVHVIAYGAARDLVLGVEAVLADGQIFRGLSKLRKDNTGYDLTHLLIGSEGTLGVITAATLKLFPRPRARVTAFVGLASPGDALGLLNFIKTQMGPALQAFELIPRIGVEFVVRHAAHARDPLAQAHPWYALLEFATQDETGLEDAVLEAMSRASAASMISGATLAMSLHQRADLWRLRELLPEAQKREGGSIKHDISVPIQCVPAFIEEASACVLAYMEGARPVPFGHMGDGNIHFNISQPEDVDTSAFLARWGDVNALVHEIVHKFGGSISAEHGIGQLKRDELRQTKDPVALDMMRAIKTALDPKGILNPGKLLS